jgi:hypothetical protein
MKISVMDERGAFDSDTETTVIGGSADSNPFPEVGCHAIRRGIPAEPFLDGFAISPLKNVRGLQKGGGID